MIKSKNNEQRRYKNDVLFIAVLVLSVCLAGLGFYLFRGEGDVVIVSVDGKEYGSYSLSNDLVTDIKSGDELENLNRMVISGGEAFVESASCPDGICSAHHPISRDGESIVCLPNRVVITVHKSDSHDEPDIVA